MTEETTEAGAVEGAGVEAAVREVEAASGEQGPRASTRGADTATAPPTLLLLPPAPLVLALGAPATGERA